VGRICRCRKGWMPQGEQNTTLHHSYSFPTLHPSDFHARRPCDATESHIPTCIQDPAPNRAITARFRTFSLKPATLPCAIEWPPKPPQPAHTPQPTTSPNCTPPPFPIAPPKPSPAAHFQTFGPKAARLFWCCLVLSIEIESRLCVDHHHCTHCLACIVRDPSQR
jgi:hypothetical protein